jgi:hypothetical protein
MGKIRGNALNIVASPENLSDLLLQHGIPFQWMDLTRLHQRSIVLTLEYPTGWTTSQDLETMRQVFTKLYMKRFMKEPLDRSMATQACLLCSLRTRNTLCFDPRDRIYGLFTISAPAVKSCLRIAVLVIL